MKVRQSTILKLIGQYDIGTQQELTEHLNKLGFNTTQATVSRDIKELRLVKTMVNGRIKYTAAAADRTESGFWEGFAIYSKRASYPLTAR